MMQATFTLAQVVDLERAAYHLDGEGSVDYSYDGIHFWCPVQDSARLVCAQDRMPLDDWHHMPDCRCTSCAAIESRDVAAA